MARNSQSAGAREQARKLQQEQERKQKRQSLFLRIGVVAVAVAVIAGLTLWVVLRDTNGGNYTEGPAPAVANEQGGFVLTSGSELAEGEDLGTVDAEDFPTPTGGTPDGAEPRAEGEPPHVLIFTDAHCVHCANFEGAYSDALRGLLDENLITLEYRSIAYLSSSSNYSARAANAFACVAEESPEDYKAYLADITANYQGQEINNATLASIAQESYGVDIESCIEDDTYRPFVAYTTNIASNSGVQGTPTIYVNDGEYNAGDFFAALTESAQDYAEEADIESDLL